jgi:hypothetical protein
MICPLLGHILRASAFAFILTEAPKQHTQFLREGGELMAIITEHAPEEQKRCL